MTSHGILFIATGQKYVQAAISAAQKTLGNNAGLAIHLFTDGESYEAHGFDQNASPFTSVDIIDNPHRRSKVDYMMHSPYDRTLYLDTDAAPHADIREMFRILERFDIAMTHDFMRNNPRNLTTWKVKVPTAFPQFNSGVVLYRKTPEVMQFFEEWIRWFHESGDRHDQPTLRELLWLNDLRIATLPPEYNVRHLKYHFLWSKSEAETKIFHLAQYHIGWFTWFCKRVGIFKWVKRIGRGFLKIGIDLKIDLGDE